MFAATTRPILVVALVLFPACASAQTLKPGDKPPSAEGQTANDPRGTNESPLIVKVQPTPKTDEETAKEKAKEQDDASAKLWTQALAWFTAGLALAQLFAIGFQVRIASQQNAIIKTQNKIMAAQRDAANTQSGYMLTGLEHAKTAANAAKDGADAAKDAADTAALALRMTHRPRLIVQLIVPDGFINADRILDSELMVTNVGVFDVALNFEFSDWFILKDLPIVNPLKAVESRAVNGVLTPGAFTKLPVPGREISMDDWIRLNMLPEMSESSKLYLIGSAKYSDPIGFRRKYFCYEYQVGKRRFVRPKTPGYNYTG